MEKALLSVALLFGLLHSESTFSQTYRYNLPHVANGSFEQGVFRTTFVVFNNTDFRTFVYLQITGDDGKPLQVSISDLGTGSSFGFYLVAGASRIFQTDGSGSLAVGAAYVTSSPADIGVSAIFSVYDNDGRFVTEAGVENCPPLRSFLVFVDATGAFDTGLALYNPTTSPASITFNLLDASGRVVSTTELTPPLAGGAHLARFVTGRDQLFPGLSDFKGTLEVSSSVVICALTLRQNSSTILPTYTSLPVLRGFPQRTSMVFPQAVNGSYGNMAFKTSFLLVNVSENTADVVLTLTQDDGSPFVATMPGAGTGSSFDIALQTGASVFLQTDGIGTGKSGAATVTSNVPIGAASIFTVFDSQGRFQTEAGVTDSLAMTDMTLPVDVTEDFDTGVAFYNPGRSPVTMTLRLLDAGGLGTGPGPTVTLDGLGHKARFVSELFPGTGNFRGTLAITAPTAVAALTLRQNLSPLSYTTLPVVAGASSGPVTVSPLLSEQMTGFSVADDIRVDKTLAAGHRLAGNVSGEGILRSVKAVSGSGSVFNGLVDTMRNTYLVVVPAGSYTLSGVFARDAVPSGVFMKLVDTTPVQVAGDTVRDITLPARNLFGVSGKVDLGSLSTALTSPMVILTAHDCSAAAGSGLGPDGAFTVSLPPGDYQVSLGGRSGRVGFGALYNIGSLQVGGDVAHASFTVPATARLSGRVDTSALPVTSPVTFVEAADVEAPAITESVYLSPYSVNTAEVEPAVGTYQLLLPGKRTYRVQARVLYTGEWLFPAGTGGNVTLVTDMVMDLFAPPTPALFTIFGRVTDSSGRGVDLVGVTAVSQSIAGAPQLSFKVNSITNGKGDYSLTVPAGTYSLTFTPPIPPP